MKVIATQNISQAAQRITIIRQVVTVADAPIRFGG